MTTHEKDSPGTGSVICIPFWVLVAACHNFGFPPVMASTPIHITAILGTAQIPFQLDATTTISELRVLLETQKGLDGNFDIVYNHRKLLGHMTLSGIGMKDGDTISISLPSRPRQIPSRRTSTLPTPQPSAPVDYVTLAQQLMRRLSEAGFIDTISRTNPPLAEMLLAGRTDDVAHYLEVEHKHNVKMQQLQAVVAADPMNLDAQREIEALIREQNVAQNLNNALEYLPEAFGEVVMLYIDCFVNGVPLKAFVDTGAQHTIMSAACAERCGIMRLIDTRFQGMAVGVGQCKILGRVHMAPLKIGGSVLPSSFTVLESQGQDFLLGLDNLKRHQCVVDLKENVLRVGSSGETVPFLAEKDIPPPLRLGAAQSPSLTPGTPRHLAPPIAARGQSAHAATSTTATSTTATSTTASPDASTSIIAPSPAASSSMPSARLPAPPLEASIQTLVALGVSRERAVRALQATNGSVEEAAILLLSENS
ncbi:putative Protein DDI1 2 [Paratrimastix pyriformis]|uniref:UBA domain-containing protein n=1 Tax=Paratrimastix pyriformis TaxID=342808 RepID=A0ABQ8UTC7_9EUKA|nr:putative Protein DDI1 2 [Paratrimastix pyriformis]